MDDFSSILNLAMSNPYLFLVVSFMTAIISGIKWYTKRQKDKEQAIKDSQDMQKTVGEVLTEYKQKDKDALSRLER